jgi:Fe-S cluster biosynthesis and repair protein YggX
MKFENTEVWGFKHALRGMRNPLESWGKSDSHYRTWEESEEEDEKIMKGDYYEIGKNDLDLAQKLIKAGSEHRKFLRQIFISVDISAPLYWWKEFDTYKVGTVSNSTSTMHKLSSTPITRECFEMDDFEDFDLESQDIIFPLKSTWESLISDLEFCRQKYNETKDKRYWKELIRLLPESWLQKRTITMNYENILNMIHQRKNHKLSEWSESFINWAKTLPYADEFFFSK